ncbi:MAG: endonuclease [Proteobacteria bacterium]|nr:MAG: endonuclease [Pseudomonadota bacterium]
MEGPSLVIATEEFEPYFGLKVNEATGTAKLPFSKIKNQKLLGARSWGKHFILIFEKTTLRIHFLMFGSYRISNPRVNRIPKMELRFGKDRLYFYSCAIKILEEPLDELYDWSLDTMSDEWSTPKAVAKLKKRPEDMVCDVLMDQEVFSGVGNIIKNEVQFRQRLHPETKIEDLTPKALRALVKDARDYSLQFYKWKKANVLKRNWLIFRKKKCPECGKPVTKRQTGKLKRVSFYCTREQKK